MKTCRTMWLVILVCQLGLILRTKTQIPSACLSSDTNRPPEMSDITVVCGAEYIDMSIYLCPVYQALYNEYLMVLNNQFDKPECFGTADWTTDPPVLIFRLPLTDSDSPCKNKWEVHQFGSELFPELVQYINISGNVNSIDDNADMITHRPQILYKFSCVYPMQYDPNNAQLGMSGVNLAIGDKISTLSMQLYKDENYQEILLIPKTGLHLKTKIYVAVEATDVTDRFNVLLDRCYITATPSLTYDTFCDLFVGCYRNAHTEVELNGKSHYAHFSFEIFRFVKHKNQIVSTFYLHCVARLCEVSTCSKFMSDSGPSHRWGKGEVQYVSDSITITSPAIIVRKLRNDETDWLSATDTPSYCEAETDYYDYLHETDPPSLAVFDGTSSLSCSSISVMAVIVCNVINMCFSI